MNKILKIFILLFITSMFPIFIIINVYSQDYKFLLKWGTKGTYTSQFNQPNGIFIDKFGFIYVADCENHRIQKFTSGGEFVEQLGGYGSADGQFHHPSDIIIDNDGFIYVSDSYNYRIQKFDLDWNFILKWGEWGTEDNQFLNTNGIAIDSKGFIYVATMQQNEVKKFDSNGNFITKWGSPGKGDGQFDLPAKIAIDKSDILYITDGNGSRVQKFTTDGKFLGQWGISGTDNGQFGHIRGIDIDTKSNVFVCDWTNHRIQKFDSNGNFITKWGNLGKGDGQLNQPYDIAIDNNGMVYVSELANHRIQVFSPANSQKLSDTSDNLWAIIKPLAESQDIDMGKVFVNTTKDSVITGYVRNTGTAPVRIDSIRFVNGDSALFDIVSGFPPFSIPVGGQNDVEFRFWPKSVGNKSADIYIYTQSDTLKHKIIGEGINNDLEVTAKLVDFDTVRIGTHRDSVLVLLRNIGLTDVNIILTELLGPDKTQFVIDSGGGSFNIPAGADRELKVKFAPEEKGRTSGQIGFYYNGIGSPAIAYLYGEGIGPYIAAIPDISYPRLLCESSSDTTITISNIGSAQLTILSHTITGNHPDDFELAEPFQPLNIDSDLSDSLVVRFNPKGSGLRKAILNLSSNMYPDSIISIPLQGLKDSVDISLSNDFIDLGILCPNESKDTNIVVENIGTVLAGVTAANSQSFTLDINNFTLDTTETQTINIHFDGSPVDGIVSEQIIFTDTICGYSEIVDIVATISGTEILAEDLNLNAVVGDSYDGALRISNPSSRDVIIAEPPIKDPPFKIIDPQFPIIVAAGSQRDVTIRYTPIDTLVYKDTLLYIGQPCDATDSSIIAGIPSPASAILQVGSAEAEAGAHIEIPIYLMNPKNVIQSGATGFKTNLSFNATLLDPIDYPDVKIHQGLRTIELNDLPAAGDENSILKEIRFVVGLGNTTETELTLTNYEAINGLVALDTIGGKFKLFGICPEGGDRLLNPETGEVSLLRVKPNPVKDIAEIEYELIEEGYTQLFITNILGKKVKTLINGVPDIGRRKITFKSMKLPTGTYFIILQTPTEVRTQRIEIIK